MCCAVLSCAALHGTVSYYLPYKRLCKVPVCFAAASAMQCCTPPVLVSVLAAQFPTQHNFKVRSILACVLWHACSHQTWCCIVLPKETLSKHAQMHSRFGLAAGYYPAILRVEHPAVRYKNVEGGTQEVEANPSELRFFDKHKGVCVGSCPGLHTIHGASDCSHRSEMAALRRCLDQSWLVWQPAKTVHSRVKHKEAANIRFSIKSLLCLMRVANS